MFSIGVPAENAQAFADLYMLQSRELLKLQKANNSAVKAALSKLQGAMSSFQTSISAINGQGSAVRLAASMSDAGMGTATVGKGAQPGSYTFVVDTLASAHQVAYAGMPAFAAEDAGSMTISLEDGTAFDVDLASANVDENGNVTPAELARAINQADGNGGKVTASIINVDGKSQLVLTAGQSGEASRITVDASKAGSAELRDALEKPPTELAEARDAVFFLGGKDGMRIKQPSNTFDGIDGVSVTFSRASDVPVRLTVEMDAAATKDAAQAFIDSYNEVMTLLGELSASGGEDKVAGPFSGDAGVRSLKQQLVEMLRGEVGGQRLMAFGFDVDRNGKLSLDADRFEAAVGKNPEALNALLGGGEDSIPSRMDAYLKTWTSPTDGHIKRRQESNQAVETSLNKKEAALDTQYSQVYERYLEKFSRVEQMQQQMQITLALLDGLPTFGEKK
ncbi:flagellar filament capping protein FliD [Burkholderia dolosa]|uniref:flagellar filament capping protein FliD n=1 Tax=Burkholderia dolosa TaxID=152500 RepID=UPI001B9A030E|nr:flagellar filament capping protein FliD [Burkholderia dolosa]MBR8313168.1 flagellar filament capping protein FliD [Burkholderia dolosa]